MLASRSSVEQGAGKTPKGIAVEGLVILRRLQSLGCSCRRILQSWSSPGSREAPLAHCESWVSKHVNCLRGPLSHRAAPTHVAFILLLWFWCLHQWIPCPTPLGFGHTHQVGSIVFEMSASLFFFLSSWG